jgi:hypothetical protein
MALRALQERIEGSLNRLRLERDGPVFLIEHGLSTAEMEELGHALREDAVVLERGHRALRPLAGSWWNSRIYGLLVFMTEVGYSYGEDREYWPKLAEELRLPPIDDELQRDLVRQFRRAIDVPPPPQTPWTSHFHRIAWPISNGLLPRWLHAELFRLLLGCPFPIDERGRHLPWLQQAAASGARRLSLLLNPDRAVQSAALIAAIIGRDVDVRGVLSESFVERVKADVMSAPDVRRLRAMVAQAQVLLRPVPAPRRPPAARSAEAGRLQALLALQLNPRSLRIAPVAHAALAEFPLDRVRAVMLGGRRFVSLGKLLREGAEVERLPDPVDMVRLVDETLPGKVPGQAGLVIESLFVDLRDPILLSSHGGRAAAVQVLERAYGSGPGWWALTKQAPPDGGPRTVANVGGWTLVDLSADEAAARAWLEARGVAVRDVARIRAVGPPPLFSREGWTFGVRDVVALRVDGKAVQLAGAGASQRLEVGAHIVQGAVDGMVTLAGQDQAGRPIRLDRRDVWPATDGPAVVLEPLAATAEDLRGGRISLRVTGTVPLAGMPISLTSQCGPNRRTLRSTLPASGSLGEDCAEWEALRRALPESGEVLLSVDVGGLAFDRWRLASTHDAIDECAPSASADGTGLPTEESWFSADEPVRAAMKPVDSAYLHVQRWGEVQRAVVWAPPRQILGTRLPTPPRVSRRAADVESVLRACSLWRGATPSNLLAGWARAAVVRGLDEASVHALCGEAWADAEAKLARGRSLCLDAAAALLVAGVGWTESEGVDLTRAQQAEPRFAALLAAEGLDAVLSGSACRLWVEGHIDALSWHVERVLAEQGVPDVDVLMYSAVVGEVLEPIVAARAGALARGLNWLITPRSLAPRLLGLADASCDLDACAEVLSRLLTGQGRWEVPVVRALLGAWCEDGPALADGFGEASKVAVVDQQGARAVRLVALGWRGGRT